VVPASPFSGRQRSLHIGDIQPADIPMSVRCAAREISDMDECRTIDDRAYIVLSEASFFFKFTQSTLSACFADLNMSTGRGPLQSFVTHQNCVLGICRKYPCGCAYVSDAFCGLADQCPPEFAGKIIGQMDCGDFSFKMWPYAGHIGSGVGKTHSVDLATLNEGHDFGTRLGIGAVNTACRSRDGFGARFTYATQ